LIKRETTTEAATTSKNIMGVLTLNLTQIGAAILFSAVIPRTMGAKHYGEFSLLISIVTIAGSVVNLAIGNTFGRFFPEFEARGKKKLINKLFINMLVFKTGFTIVFCSLLFIVLKLSYENQYSTICLILVVLIVIITDWESVFFSVQYGFNKQVMYAARQPLRRLASVFLILILFQSFGLVGAISASCIISIIMLIIGMFLSKGYIKLSKQSIRCEFIKPYMRFGATISAAWIFTNIWRTGGNILIDFLTGDSKAVAYYDIAQRLFLVASSFTFILTNALVPIFTTLLLTYKSNKIVEWSERITRYTCMLNMIGLGVFIVLGLDIIQYVIGKEYYAIYPFAVVMLLSIFPLVLAQIGFVYSMVYKEQLKYLLYLAISVFVFGISAILLIPKYSVMGCAIANVISYYLLAALVVFGFRSKMFSCITEALKVFFIGAVISPILLVNGDLAFNLGIAIAFSATYLLILFATKQLSFQEVEEVIVALRYKNTVR